MGLQSGIEGRCGADAEPCKDARTPLEFLNRDPSGVFFVWRGQAGITATTK
jgi:hypothetical protein